jgi:8-amino-7-oxononanoate synthase
MSPIDPIERLIATRNQRQAEGLLRRLRTIGGNDGAYTVVDGRRLLNFSSNDYLGLAGHRLLVAALKQSADEHGVGATAAHLVCGHRAPHAALEDALAEWTGRERALLFSTGYMANLGVISALLGAGDLCVQDKLNHACLLDGARLAGCTLKRYPHGDVDAANRQLANAGVGAAMLATDGVFSMDGDIAPLHELAALAREQRATLLVDDAHGIGVLGADGAGSVAEAGLDSVDVPILMATLGKAVGTAGAFVAGSAALIDALMQFARTYVYTTAMPPALAAASLAAVGIARKDAWRREQLAMLVERFRTGALAMGVSLGQSRTPVQPILVGTAERAMALAAALEDDGLLAIAIRPPTVPPGGARLRITFTALHQAGDVDRLLQALESHAPHWR